MLEMFEQFFGYFADVLNTMSWVTNFFLGFVSTWATFIFGLPASLPLIANTLLPSVFISTFIVLLAFCIASRILRVFGSNI